MEKVGRGNERAIYVYGERSRRRKSREEEEEESGDGLTVKCALVVSVAGFTLVSLVF